MRGRCARLYDVPGSPPPPLRTGSGLVAGFVSVFTSDFEVSAPAGLGTADFAASTSLIGFGGGGGGGGGTSRTPVRTRAGRGAAGAVAAPHPAHSCAPAEAAVVVVVVVVRHAKTPPASAVGGAAGAAILSGSWAGPRSTETRRSRRAWSQAPRWRARPRRQAFGLSTWSPPRADVGLS